MGKSKSMENYSIQLKIKYALVQPQKANIFKLKMKKQGTNFNKSDLAIHLSRKFPSLNDEVINESIDLVLQEIINTVALDNRVEIRGFGSFSKKQSDQEDLLILKTKEESYLGETSIMHFKASKKLLQIND